MFVPEVADHGFAREALAAPGAVHLQPLLAAFENRVQAAALIDLMLKLPEPFQPPQGREPRREWAGDLQHRSGLVREFFQKACRGIHANWRGNRSIGKKRPCLKEDALGKRGADVNDPFQKGKLAGRAEREEAFRDRCDLFDRTRTVTQLRDEPGTLFNTCRQRASREFPQRRSRQRFLHEGMAYFNSPIFGASFLKASRNASPRYELNVSMRSVRRLSTETSVGEGKPPVAFCS